MSFEMPDACTLPTAERPLRLAEFDGLFATAFERLGYTDVRLYEGGKADWAQAGLALHGTRTGSGAPARAA